MEGKQSDGLLALVDHQVVVRLARVAMISLSVAGVPSVGYLVERAIVKADDIVAMAQKTNFDLMVLSTKINDHFINEERRFMVIETRLDKVDDRLRTVEKLAHDCCASKSEGQR